MAIKNALSLTTVASNLYVSSGNTVVSTMYFCNTSGSAVYLNMWLLDNSSFTANTSNQVYAWVQIASNDTLVVDMEKLVFANSERLVANVSANSAVSGTVSYVGI